jgi:hypothetical protein
MLRLLAVIATVWIGLFASSPGAEARVNIEINVGSTINHGRRISCAEGRRILLHRGFRDVRARDCRGSVFTYTGRRNGSWWWIDVRARDGRILRLQRRR